MLDPVEKEIRLILAAYDPLPPGFSEAHYDEDYYSDEAAAIYAALPGATSLVAVRRLVREAFEQTLPGVLAYARRTDERLDARVDAIAHAIWDLVRP